MIFPFDVRENITQKFLENYFLHTGQSPARRRTLEAENMLSEEIRKPEKKVIQVVGAVVRDGAKVLVGRRPLDKSCGGLWEFIGGKIESGETPEETLARECMEEAALKITDIRAIAETTHDYPQKTVHLILMECRAAAGSSPVPLEHLELRWVDANQARELEFCPADVGLLEKIFAGTP